jgi:DUF1009 family protein
LPDLIVELDRRAAALPEQRIRLSQAAIVAAGQLIAIEHSSTDGLLRRAGRAGHGLGDRYLLKMPSVGFYPALDQPAIGPKTAEGAVKAGLNGLIVCAELTIIIDRERTIEVLDRAGLFLHAVPLPTVCDVYARRLDCDWADAMTGSQSSRE